jgi:hypothetical protein
MKLTGLCARMKRLEDAAAIGQPCRDCGHVTGEPFAFVICTDASDRGEQPPPSDLQHCGRCGSLSGSFTMNIGAVEFDGVDGADPDDQGR